MTHNQLRSFSSLSWYEESLTFLFTFAAKTSELLLAAGLVVSTANFLTDGSVMSNNLFLAHAWAWAQALAIDSSLGITFYSIIACIKERDWIKSLLYGLLTLLLAIVAISIPSAMPCTSPSPAPPRRWASMSKSSPRYERLPWWALS